MNIGVIVPHTTTYSMADERIRFYLQLMSTASNAVFKEIPLNGLNDLVNQTLTQVDQYGDREYETEEFFKFDDVDPNGYRFSIKAEMTGSSFPTITVAPDNDTDSYIAIDKVNQAGDERILDVPSNMPYGTDGVLQEEFIKSIQKKYNLVIYPSKTKPKEFVIESYNDWVKNYKVRNWDNYVDLSQKMEVIPINNEGYKKLQFGDTLDVDYPADQFDKLNNREFGKIYYTDTQNFYSEGEKVVESGFGVSPLVYVQGTGLSGSVDIPDSYPIQVKLGNTVNTVCNATAVQKWITRNDTSLQVGDILYDDLYLTQPTTGFVYAKDNTLDIVPIYDMNQFTGEITQISGEKCGGFSP